MQLWFVLRRIRGFTQIELAVTIVVLGVLMAIAVPSISQWLRRTQVNRALDQIALALQETQTEAVKRHRSCRLTLPRGANPTIQGTCLASGNFVLNDVFLKHSRRDPNWIITFNFKGENPSPGNNPGSLWIVDQDPNFTVRSKCLVISVGIGLRRIGQKESGACITP